MQSPEMVSNDVLEWYRRARASTKACFFSFSYRWTSKQRSSQSNTATIFNLWERVCVRIFGSGTCRRGIGVFSFSFYHVDLAQAGGMLFLFIILIIFVASRRAPTPKKLSIKRWDDLTI